MTSMNFEWFETNWDLLSKYATDDIKTLAEPFLQRNATCIMMDGIYIIDKLTRLAEGKERCDSEHISALMKREYELTNEDVDDILGIRNEDVKGMFYCGVCKTKDHTRFDMKQTRSGDEGMTAFIECRKCGNHWKR
jgi:DNA-directed RNA polymerase subunit M/transcription elongation factor TFIIS